MFNIVDGVLTSYTGSLEVVELPEEVTEIKPLIFRSHPEIRLLDLSKTKVKNLLTKTFFECKNIYEIKLPETLEVIGYQAFSNCQSLEELIIPDSVIEIQPGAFEECCNLTTLRVPESIKVIEMNVFRNCSSIIV